MKIYPECVPCLLKRVLYESELVAPEKAHMAQSKALEIINDEYHEGIVSVDLATKVHHAVYDILGTEDPYREVKKRSNQVADMFRPKVEEYLAEVEEGTIDGLKAHEIVAIIGNVLDFGIRGGMESPEALEDAIDGLIEEGLGYDDTRDVHDILSSDKEGGVAYIADNCGEIVFDTYLVSYIRSVYPRDVYYVVRGGPILSDVTMEDAEWSGMTKVATKVLTTNSRFVGIDMDSITPELRDKINESVLVIAKGMANWEALSERHSQVSPIAYMMRTKCYPVAHSMGVPQDKNVVKIFR